MKQWYVAHTRPNGEARAVAHLRRQGFENFLPVFARQRRHARKIDTALVPLFPRYVFVALDVDVQRWRSINGTMGVDHLVCDGAGPLPVRPGIVEALMRHADAAGRVRPASLQVFRPGDRLKVVGGALCDQVGTFDTLTADERVVLLMNVLGREVRIAVPIGVVDAA